MPRLKIIGALLALLCVGFIIHQAFGMNWQQISGEQWSNMAVVVFGGSIIYAFFSFTLSFAWWRLLIWSGEKQAFARICHGIYGRAQLAKYLPGNIFSIVGRHFLGRKFGLENQTLIWAATLEFLGMLCMSSLIVVIGGIYHGEFSPIVDILILFSSLTFPVLLLWVIVPVFQRFPKLRPFGLPVISFRAYLRLYGIFFNYLPFFLLNGVLLWWCIYEAGGGVTPSFIFVLTVSVSTWLAGYVTPGASGGIGVRDALIILALKPMVGESVIVAVLIFRLTTILGDVFYFLSALMFPLKHANIQESSQNISQPNQSS